MNNTNININDLIQNEVNRISLKYGKDFLDCDDLTLNNAQSEVQNG